MTLYDGLDEALADLPASVHTRVRWAWESTLEHHASIEGELTDVVVVRTGRGTATVTVVVAESEGPLRTVTTTSSPAFVNGPVMVLVDEDPSVRPRPEEASITDLRVLAAARSRVDPEVLHVAATALHAARGPASRHEPISLGHVVYDDHPRVSRSSVEEATAVLADLASGVPVEWALRSRKES